MKVNVRFFALYRERAGASERDWELRESATLDDLLREIRDAYPGLAPPDVDIVAAVNEEYAEGRLTLREGDEVALIPPVSGGGDGYQRRDSSLRFATFRMTCWDEGEEGEGTMWGTR